nr:PFL family protein [uncultured Ruminococcus sp.]
MLETRDILETINMIDNENLDVRTITMGISLLDCIDEDIDKACTKVYDKICRSAKDLVKTGEDIEKEYGIPIINKRISVTPIGMVAAPCQSKRVVKFAHTLDKAAKELGVNFIGGYSALVQKGFASGDYALIESIPEALSETDFVCSSVNVGSTKAGINMDAVKMMGKVVKKTAEITADRNCIGAAKLVIFCNAPEDNPFMAGAFHGVGESDTVINVGVSGPGVVRAALAKNGEGKDIAEIADLVKSLAPTPAVGDSVAYILEEMGLEKCGCHGTTATLALLNDAVKKGGVMASSHVGGLSGAFIPVSEDAGMIAAAKSGHLDITKLEAMTAVCSVGLDMIVVPGDITPEVISAIIADEAAIGMVNTKTTAVRLIPAIGRKAGDMLEFGGLLGSGPVMPVREGSPAVFINRGGRIPAPLQALKN